MEVIKVWEKVLEILLNNNRLNEFERFEVTEMKVELAILTRLEDIWIKSLRDCFQQIIILFSII